MFRARKVRWLDEIRRVVYGVEKKRGCTYMCYFTEDAAILRGPLAYRLESMVNISRCPRPLKQQLRLCFVDAERHVLSVLHLTGYALLC